MQEILGTLIAGEQVVIQNELVLSGQWKFGCAIGSAIHPVQIFRQCDELFLELVSTDCIARLPLVDAIEFFLDALGVVVRFFWFFAIHFGQFFDDLLPLFFGEIGACVNGLHVGQTNHIEWPSASAGHDLTSVHVYHVDVWSFLPIHFDAYQMVVHDFGGFKVLETFVLHHVAPMAGAVADAHQDQFVFRFCTLPSVIAPFFPSHGVVCMLKQVRAVGMDECVGLVVVHAIVDCVGWVRHLWAGLLNFVFDEKAWQRSHSTLDSQSIFGVEFIVDFAGGGAG